MKNNYVVQKWWKNSYKLLLIFSCLLALTLGWGGNNLANAATLTNNEPLLADLGFFGQKNQIEGRAQQDIGRTQSALDAADKKVEHSRR